MKMNWSMVCAYVNDTHWIFSNRQINEITNENAIAAPANTFY